jgi:hypothetical protein
MRNDILVLVCLLSLIGFVGMAQSAQMSLAGAWAFDDGTGKVAKDSVAGDNGELKGSLKWSAQGKFGGAIEFPGKGDSYVNIPYKKYMDSDAYTFTAWTKLNESSYQYVAWQDGPDFPDAKNKRHLDIWIDQGDFVVFMWQTEAGVQGRLDGKTIIADGTWHHLAKWYDGKSVKMYIDGKLDGEIATTKIIANGEDSIWIGARPGDVSATGIIDEVGFFTKALSEDELRAVMKESMSVLASVDSANKLSTTWGDLKNKS